MPEPQPHPHAPQILRVARHAVIAGVAIMAAKFGIYAWTQSIAVLSDAMESIINVVAAAFMLYTLWFSNRPADRDHPYGHGKVEFMSIGAEGWMILIAGVVVGWKAIGRLIDQTELDPFRLTVGTWMIGGMGVATGALAGYVWWSGRRLNSPVLTADGKHLMTDCASTVGVLLGLVLVRYTGKDWLDPIVALVMAAIILFTSWKLLWQSISGLMDTRDPQDDSAIRDILDEEVTAGAIKAYHKVRLRHNGTFHWVDMHLQVDPKMTVRESHDIASRIEARIEAKLGQADATAHIEPFEGKDIAPADDPTDPSAPKAS